MWETTANVKVKAFEAAGVNVQLAGGPSQTPKDSASTQAGDTAHQDFEDNLAPGDNAGKILIIKPERDSLDDPLASCGAPSILACRAISPGEAPWPPARASNWD